MLQDYYKKCYQKKKYPKKQINKLYECINELGTDKKNLYLIKNKEIINNNSKLRSQSVNFKNTNFYNKEKKLVKNNSQRNILIKKGRKKRNKRNKRNK